MYVSGTNFRLTPEVSSIQLTFENLTVLGTGQAEIGVSGGGNKLLFLFSGNRIVSPDKRFVGTYNTGESFDFKWTLGTNFYHYSLNNRVLKKTTSRTEFDIQRFFINSTGAALTMDAKFFCPNIETSLDFDDTFFALSRLTGKITNNSPYKFRIFDSSLVFYSSNATPLTGKVTGDATGNADRVISFADTNSSRFDSSIQFSARFDTSIGVLSGVFSSNRVSGLDLVVSKVTTEDRGITMSSLFDGSGISGNKYTYVPTPVTHLMSFFCSSYNLRGESRDKTVIIGFEPISPENSGSYKSEYVTGFSLVSGGEYLYPPYIKVTGYYQVSGLDWPLNSVLLSSGCSGDITVVFSGFDNYGTGASGILKTRKTRLSGIFNEGVTDYYLPQSFELVSGGTGYLTKPKAILKTGVFSECYDVAAKYNSTYLLYKPFSGSGAIVSLADFLTGEVLVVASGISGHQVSGYTVTGIEFTNIGSGYNSGMFPKVSFHRRSGDNYTAHATGNFLMKSTGSYLTTGNWSLKTGISSLDLHTLSGLSGTGYLTSLDNYLTVEISYSGLDITQPVVAKLTVSLSGANTLVHYVTGVRSYDTSTGYLKKKNKLTFSPVASGTDLSFLLTQDDLDDYYSSSDFINPSATIDVGDLEF